MRMTVIMATSLLTGPLHEPLSRLYSSFRIYSNRRLLNCAFLYTHFACCYNLCSILFHKESFLLEFLAYEIWSIGEIGVVSRVLYTDTRLL